MKKIQVVALGAFVAVGALFTSCGGGVSSDASLKTENDTISYAFGASLYDQGLSMHLQQLGVVSDTTGLGAFYKRQIDAEQDSFKKDSLQKEMKHKLDSTVKVNERNIAEFLKGLKESIDAPDSKSAYYAGISVGGQISKQMFPNLITQMYGPDSKEKINSSAFIAAMATAMKKGKFALNDPASLFQVKMQEVQAKAQARQEEELKKQYTPQIEAGQKFLDENKSKEGVVVLPDGIQYKIVKEGTGAKPTATDVVKVHYHGTLLDGTVFDSSVDRKEPSTFNVSAVIKGWTEVLQLMPVGSKWTVYIPYDLAYGAQDRGAIKPFSTLIFDIELLDIEKK